MRQRRSIDTPPASPPRSVCSVPKNGSSEKDDKDDSRDKDEESMLKMKCAKDVLARCFFVGIFITENFLHSMYFQAEIEHMVAPALAPLPREIAVCLHMAHIVLGLFGAIFVIVSGFDTAGRTALTKGTSMMLVFMGSITWTWWINRKGKPYWEMDPYWFWDTRCSEEKRNRAVHILKNISIVGALTMVQQIAKYDMQARPSRPSWLQGVITSLRPWSLTASFAPLLVMLAVLQGRLRIELPAYLVVFTLLLSIVAVQIVANLANSYVDFARGVDTKETAGDRTLVDQLISTRSLFVLIVISMVCWVIAFAASIMRTGGHPVVLSMGALGTLLALGYTVGPAPLKYLGLGDLTVFICFGPALIAYGCVVLTGAVQLEALYFTLPVSMLVVATLHANNYRDMEADRRAGATTFALRLGREASLHYYSLLVVGAHIVVLVAGWQLGCAGALASLCVLPQSLWLCIRIRQAAKLLKQDEETAKTTMMFGLALAIGIVSMPGAEISKHGLGFALLVTCILKVFAD